MQPMSIGYSNSVTLNPSDAAADFYNGTLTSYVQDQLKLTDELTVTAGVRNEVYVSNTKILENPNFVERYGFSNTATLNGKSITMPRLGLSYLATDHLNLRAGAGLYSGGSPTVWVSNAYTNNGVGISSATSMDPTVINGFNGRDIPQGLKDLIKAGNGNTDALDPSFKIPSVWKVGGGADWALDDLGEWGKAAIVKLNYTFTKTQHGVLWQDLRRDLAVLPANTPVGTLPDGRPLYDTMNFNANRGYDMLLTNTSRGYGHSASLMVEKTFPFGLYISGSYAYQHVLEVNPANSSRSVSNYDNVAIIDPNHPELAVSNYERAHHLTLALELSHAFWGTMKTSFGLFAEARSGQPYSWTMGDANFGTTLAKMYGQDRSIASHDNELFYVPKGDGTDVTLNGIDPADFDRFLKQTGLDKYRGQIVPRNAFRSPWYARVDVRLAQDLPNPLNSHRARVVIDIENVGNLIDHKWGRSTSVPFPFQAPAVDVSYDAPSGKYVYSNLRTPDPSRVDVLASVWRASIGLMYDF